jgi:Putative Ig domain
MTPNMDRGAPLARLLPLLSVLVVACSATSTPTGANSGPISDATVLQVYPGQSIYACSDALGNSVMPQTLLAFGGNPGSAGYVWTLSSSNSLPAGMTVAVNQTTGILTGSIPDNFAAGNYPVNVTVSDGVTTATGSVTIAVNAGTIAPANGWYAVKEGNQVTACPVRYNTTFSTNYNDQSPAPSPTIPGVDANMKYGASVFQAGITSVNWTLFDASESPLPPGLQLNPQNGTIYGTVTAGTPPGNYSFGVEDGSSTIEFQTTSPPYVINTN